MLKIINFIIIHRSWRGALRFVEHYMVVLVTETLLFLIGVLRVFTCNKIIIFIKTYLIARKIPHDRSTKRRDFNFNKNTAQLEKELAEEVNVEQTGYSRAAAF